ncbi:hypothetical protein GQ600_4241 [Phytophthora cactorum]|nr:hypothetical protein GQ600_4241 [Phytophthora cactorum]
MQPFRTLPFDEDGGREVFDGPVKQKQHRRSREQRREGSNSEKSSTKSVSSHQNAARPGMKICAFAWGGHSGSSC